MSYLSGTKVIDSDGAAQNILSLIEQGMTEAGWVFVETYNSWRVWKCPASLNGVQDFHVMFAILSSALHFSQFEDYNPATHQSRRGMAVLGVNNVVPPATWDATSQSPHGQVWTTLQTPGSQNAYYQVTAWSAFPSSQFNYVVACGSKSLTFSFTWPGSAFNQNIGKWVGLFDTIIKDPANDPMPFAMFDPWASAISLSGSSSGSAPYGATSRTPLPATHSSWSAINYIFPGLSVATGLPFSAAAGSAAAQFNSLGGSSDAWGAPAEIGPKYILHGVRHLSDGRTLNLRGVVPGMVSFGAGSGIYVGDEFVFNGATYSVISYIQYGMGLAINKALA